MNLGQFALSLPDLTDQRVFVFWIPMVRINKKSCREVCSLFHKGNPAFYWCMFLLIQSAFDNTESYR